MRDSSDANRGDDDAVAPTPAEVALHRLRMLGLGLIAAAVVLSALQAPYARWSSLRTRIAMRLDPLDPAEGVLVSIVADLLSATDGFAAPR